MSKEVVSRRRIEEIAETFHHLYQAIQNAGEFGKLDDEDGFKDSNTGTVYSISGTIEVWSDNIMGYVLSIINGTYNANVTQKTIERAKTSVEVLQRVDIFERDWFWEWYQKDIERFPHVKQYIFIVDYLRLVAIHHLKEYVLPNLGV